MMRRGPGLAVVLILLAGCDDGQTDGGNPGLFEPFMFNDVPYNVSFIETTPINDPALLSQGFIASNEIEVYRMTEPFSAADAAEAGAVAAAFCVGITLVFVPGAEGILGDDAGFVFARNCLERES